MCVCLKCVLCIQCVQSDLSLSLPLVCNLCLVCSVCPVCLMYSVCPVCLVCSYVVQCVLTKNSCHQLIKHQLLPTRHSQWNSTVAQKGHLYC